MKTNRMAWVLPFLILGVAAAQQHASTSGTNAATNKIRSQAIASWLSNVTTTAITKTGGITTIVVFYRTNALSEEDFSAIRAKAEKGDEVSQYQLGSLYSWGAVGDTNCSEALKWITKAANQGLSEAQVDIGWLYDSGILVKKDQAEAFRWFRKAADIGNSEAQRTLAQRYEDGEGVQGNTNEAIFWYTKSAESGDVEAQYNLARMYGGGFGITNNSVKAAYWYRKAAEQGDADSQNMLAWAYKKGQGVETNSAKAAKWFRKAAEQSLPDAQCTLGFMYSIGDGVPKDSAEAVRWYRLSAEHGNLEAQFDIGVMYQTGEGVLQDYEEAVKWYRIVANQGHADAQINLGKMYVNGAGVPQDYVEAYKWFNLAAVQGGETAIDGRRTIAKFMTSSQIAEAQQLSREFTPRKIDDSPKANLSRKRVSSQPVASGTGFFISEDGFLVTNEHVARSAAQIRLVTSAGLISAKVVKVDAANDLALLKAEGRFAALPVAASRGVKLGGTVATVGFPNIGLQGFAPKLAKGEIASLSGAGDDARYFQISVPVQPGNSGGALVDERGNVVGVVSAKLNASAALRSSGALPENVNYAVKSSYLLSFLESVPDVASKLKEASGREKKFEDVVKEAEQAAVLVLVY
jgi:TPR repeat protein